MDGEPVERYLRGEWEQLAPFKGEFEYDFNVNWQYRIKPKEPMFRIFKRNGGAAAVVLVRNSINPMEEDYYQTVIKEKNIIYLTDWLPFPPGTTV